MNGHDLKLGQVIEGKAERDAIHIAVAPVIAAHDLKAGEHVGVFEGISVIGRSERPIGVVDPYLTVPVMKGQRFWLFMYPNTITGLRHHWSHPQITQAGYPIANESERWLHDFADEVGADYYEMMQVAETHCEGSGRSWPDYLIEGGRWEGQGTPAEFWEHFKVVTGKAPKEDGLPGIFSCSC